MDGAGLDIVPMRASDLDDVLEIERRSHPAPWSRQIFIDELAREWSRLVVLKVRARAGMATAAFCNYWLVGDEVHLLNIATHPEHRRHGHAGRLLDHLVAVGRQQVARAITLEVRRSNLGAIKLYRARGFLPIGLRQHYYVDNGEDAVVMLLELADEAVASPGPQQGAAP